MRFLLLTGLTASTAFIFYSGCGSSSSPDEASSGIDGGGGGGDGASSIVADGASAASDGSSALDGTASAVDASLASPDANGGRFTDASPAIGSDGGAADDGGAGGSTSQLPCGTTTCALATDFCCVYQNNNGPPDFVFACATGSGCPKVATAKDPTALLCSGAANCASGSVCCVRDDGNRIWSECAASCTMGVGTATAQLCDPAAAQTGCSASAPCSTNMIGDWNLPNGYATCGGMAN